MQKRFALVGLGKSDTVAIGFEFVVAVAGSRAPGMGSDLNETGGPRGLHDCFGKAVFSMHGAWSWGMHSGV